MNNATAARPWTVYVRTLRGALDRMLKHAGPAPFTRETISTWMASLTFIPLSSCDGDCALMADFLPQGPEHPILDFDSVNWQVVLRFQCALDFCRGLVLKRKEFDWSQEPKEIYRWLLITLWHENAFHWASVMFGAIPTLARQKAGKLPEHFWLRGGVHPEKN